MSKYGYKDVASGVWIPANALMLPVDRLVTADWNPNRQSDKVFKNLVSNIEENGFLEAVVVAPITGAMRSTYLTNDDGGEYFLIVGGAHRRDAGVMLGMTAIPCIVKEDWNEDMVKFQNMRLNMLKGRIDPMKFASLYEEMQRKGYEEDLLRAQMGLVEEKALKNLIKNVKENLPKPVAEALESRQDSVRNQDDLGRVLNELFSQHGSTLPFGFMVFDYGGKTNYWIPMTKETKAVMDDLSKTTFEEKLDLNVVIQELLKNPAAVAAAREAARSAADSEADALFS